MKSLKHLLLSVGLLVSTLGMTTSANAVLITQSFAVDGTSLSGSFTLNIDDSLMGNGIQYFDESFIVAGSFEFWGWTDYVFDFFDVGIDTDNVLAGIETLMFDIQDVGFPETWQYSFNYDAFDTSMNSFDIFNVTDPTVSPAPFVYAAFGDRLSLQQATFVSEPSALALMVLAFAGLMMRRRKA